MRKALARQLSSYLPFIAISTTLHAFPLGVILFQEMGVPVVLEPHLSDYSVLFVESPMPSSPPSPSLSVPQDLCPKPSEAADLKSTALPILHSKAKETSEGDIKQEKVDKMNVISSAASPNFHVSAVSSNEEPIYPLEARESGIEGTVLLRLTIDPLGKIVQVEPLPPFAPLLLQRAAMRAVQQWTFRVSGATAPFKREIPIKFELSEG